MKEDNKNMFTMNRDFNVSGFGYGVNFKKGVPTFVPALLHTEAMRCGAVALDEDSVAHIQVAQARQPEVQGETRVDTIIRAMDELVKKNGRMDFGANGLPTSRAIFRLTGIDIENNELGAIWKQRVAALKAAAEPSNLNTDGSLVAPEAEPEPAVETETVAAVVEEAPKKEAPKKAAPKKKAAAKAPAAE